MKKIKSNKIDTTNQPFNSSSYSKSNNKSSSIRSVNNLTSVINSEENNFNSEKSNSNSNNNTKINSINSNTNSSTDSNTNSSTYWTVSHGISNRLYTCRECKSTIYSGENIAVRDARKIRLVYHEKCFSGDSDPRSQKNSSFNTSHLRKVISIKAPKIKGYGKWSTQNIGYIGS